ncbi:hypothetical protein Tco_1526444 [Tanacetum coccineum]
MANLSEDIQCASSDTRLPMLDRTDFASWQQRIRLYCRDKDRYNADIQATNILLQGLPKDIYSLINHYTDAKDIWDNVKMLLQGTVGYGGAQNKVGNANLGQARLVKCYNYNAQENGVALDEEQLLFLVGEHDNAIDEDVDEQPVQDLALNVDNVSQADDCDALDSDVDEAPTTQTMFMANLSYDSDILSEVHDHDQY